MSEKKTAEKKELKEELERKKEELERKKEWNLSEREKEIIKSLK